MLPMLARLIHRMSHTSYVRVTVADLTGCDQRLIEKHGHYPCRSEIVYGTTRFGRWLMRKCGFREVVPQWEDRSGWAMRPPDMFRWVSKSGEQYGSRLFTPLPGMVWKFWVDNRAWYSTRKPIRVGYGEPDPDQRDH